jgi:ATP-dependent Clp protease ATP-binding subunit ClpA
MKAHIADFIGLTTMKARMADRMGLMNKLGDSAREIVRQAYEEAKLLNDDQLRAEHALVAISKLFQPQFESLMHELNLDSETVLQTLTLHLSQRTSPVEAVKISQEFSTMLIEALNHARQFKREEIEAIDILFGLIADQSGPIAKLFEQLGVDRGALLRQVEAWSTRD